MCGCGGKKSNQRSVPSFRPSSSALRPVLGGVAAGASLETLRALNLQTATAPAPKSASRIDAERLNMMKRRRAAIKAKFNK
jgi:hypothetical protein